MRKYLYSAVFLGVLAGCGADNPKAKTEPQITGTATVHSLSIKLRKGTENSLIGGMWYLPQNVRRAFFFSGKIDGKTTLKDPIFKYELAVQCLNVACGEFTFTLLEPETSTRVPMRARVYEIAAVKAKPEDTLPESTSDYRVFWQKYLAGETDLAASSVVMAESQAGKYLSTTLVGVSTPAFHFYYPSESTLRISFDYQSHDSSFYGAGHAPGELSLGKDVGKVQMPGGQIELKLK